MKPLVCTLYVCVCVQCAAVLLSFSIALLVVIRVVERSPLVLPAAERPVSKHTAC